MSISSSLGITSLTGTGLAKGAFWSRCQDFSRNAKGQHFTTNISYSITWCQVLLDRFDWFWHVWNLDLEPHWSQGWLCHVSNQFVLCELTFISITWSWSTVNYISFPPQEQIPKVGERGLGWAWRAVRPSQLWCVQVRKSHQQSFCTCVDQNSIQIFREWEPQSCDENGERLNSSWKIQNSFIANMYFCFWWRVGALTFDWSKTSNCRSPPQHCEILSPVRGRPQLQV